MKEVTDIFKDLINGLDTSLELKQVSHINDYTFFTVCDTKWASIGKIINVQDIDNAGITTPHRIVSVSPYGYIVINGVHNTNKIYLNSPYYLSGTKISTNNEWVRAGNDVRNKLPLCWLYSNYRETVYGDEASLERTITMNIAFLDETNPRFQTNDEHIENAVIPMKKLANEFIKSINKNAIYKKLNQFTLNTYSRFGVESERGVIQNILDADLGGVVLNVTLDKFKEPCKC